MTAQQVARTLNGGMCEALQTPHGAGRGLRVTPRVLFLVGASPKLVGWLTQKLGAASMPMRPFVLCKECEAADMMPAPPSSMGLNQAPEPLFTPGTAGHALHIMTWATAFARLHEHEVGA